MWKELSTFHKDLRMHEEKGVKHWWNRKNTPGADCVDWPPMFDFFARRRIPESREGLEIDFSTMNPEQLERIKERMRARGMTEEQIEARIRSSGQPESESQ